MERGEASSYWLVQIFGPLLGGVYASMLHITHTHTHTRTFFFNNFFLR